MQVKTKNLLTGALAVFAVALLWFQFVYSPMESKASKARTSAHDADQAAAQLRRQLSGAGGQKNAKNPDPETAAMVEAVPVDAAEASFLRAVDALRVQSGAAWQSITPTAGTATAVGGASLMTVNVGISVQGSFAQLLQYVRGLSELKRLFVVDNVTLTGNGSKGPAGAGSAGSPASDQMQLQVSGRIFSQAGVPAASPTGSAPTSGTPVAKASQTG
ncbi:MAG: Tfp pilus assembly protein PilO [Actinomycetia bacterium]|nr:Tfp pilus assembly protein PilO [Actinomycetes bacterium]